MSIRIDHETGLITLHTLHTSYQMWADGQGVVHHLYYGPAIGGSDLRGLEFYSDCGFSPQPAGMDRQRDYSLDTLCQEYTGSGVGDYRIGCLRLAGPDGGRAADLRFVSAEAVPGKYALPGLPAACAEDGACETLRLKLRDAVHGLTVTLLYGVFAQADVITRAALLENEGSGPIRLDKAASACLDLPFGPWELIHFHGRHCMERQPERVPLSHNIQTLRSARGASSHQHNPFAILAAPHTTEEAGDCLGAMLVWSGSFKIECEVNQMQSTRLVAGVSDDDFSWTLEPGGQFAAPEVLFCYSEAGLGERGRVRLEPVGDRSHGLLVRGRAALLPLGARHAQVRLGVGGVLGEGRRRHVEVLVDHAGAERGRAKAHRVGVHRGAHGPHDGELLGRERPRVAGLAEHLDDVAGLHGKRRVVGRGHALPRLARPPAVAQDETVHAGLRRAALVLGGKGGHPHGDLLGAHARHDVDGGGADGVRDAVGLRQALDVLLAKPLGGDHAQVPERRLVVVGVRRRAHVRAAHAHAGEEAAAQGHDPHDREEAAERGPDRPAYAPGKRAHRTSPAAAHTAPAMLTKVTGPTVRKHFLTVGPVTFVSIVPVSALSITRS